MTNQPATQAALIIGPERHRRSSAATLDQVVLGSMQVAAGGRLITQRPELILPPIFDGNRNCVQVGLHGLVNLREYPAEFGDHGCIFWPWRLGEGVARHCD